MNLATEGYKIRNYEPASLFLSIGRETENQTGKMDKKKMIPREKQR